MSKMANCAIYEKATQKIIYFILDCTRDKRDFRGSSGSVFGVKEHLFGTFWTEDIIHPTYNEEGVQTGWDKAISDLSPALLYHGKVVSNSKMVDAVTRELIVGRYSSTDETKILRLKLSGEVSEWEEYKSYVSALVKDGKDFKAQHFNKGV